MLLDAAEIRAKIWSLHGFVYQTKDFSLAMIPILNFELQ